MTNKTLTRKELLANRDYVITWELYPTTACNLKCSYCYNAMSDHPLNKTPEPNYSLEELVTFLNKYANKGDSISLIGGEPFLRLNWLEDIMKATEDMDFDYYAYTNGTLLSRVPKELLNKFSNLSISVDGDAEGNDACRGKGVFSKIIQNLEHIKPYYKGKTIARMTIMPDNNLVNSVRALLPHFDVIYWQYANGIDMTDFPTEKKWGELNEVLGLWLGNLMEGEVLPLYSFMRITGKLLGLPKEEGIHQGYPPKGQIGCGAGYNYVQIFTTGDIYACPELLLQERNYMGNIRTGIERQIGLKDFENAHKCFSCPESRICNTRCLHFTPEEYCTLVKRTISTIRDNLPKIEELIADGKIDESQFAMKKHLVVDRETRSKEVINYADIESMF